MDDTILVSSMEGKIDENFGSLKEFWIIVISGHQYEKSFFFKHEYAATIQKLRRNFLQRGSGEEMARKKGTFGMLGNCFSTSK